MKGPRPTSEGDPLALSTLDPRGESSDAPAAAVPCLTLLSHPDLRRVGDRALLSPLLMGLECEISRLGPDFMSREGTRALPLGDPFISRRPFVLRPGEGPGELALVDPSGRVRVGFERHAAGPHRLSSDSLQRGTPIVIADRVVLWLHLTRYVDSSIVGDIEGGSDAVETLRREVARAGPLPYPVLIRGETGVGKELVARALHRLSPRSKGPFVAVNMATLTDGTAPSLLFGHRRGAFTGANSAHRGLFERADGGTLFLDEIGATPEAVQPMLLRAIEEGKVLALGAEQERGVDVRIVAATDAPLEDMRSSGTFSAALHHRLSGYELRVPPLRERIDDIPCLFARFLLEELGALGPFPERDVDESPAVMPPQLTLDLLRHPLPGNVREVRNLARRAAMDVCAGEAIRLPADGRPAAQEAAQLDTQPPSGAPESRTGNAADRKSTRRRVSREELHAALRAHDWSPERAADALGIPRSTVHHLMRQDPEIRRATDFADEELSRALEEAGHDVGRAAAILSVSRRALMMTLRRRGLIQHDA